MPAYNGRVLAYLLSTLTFITGILIEHFDKNLIWFVPFAMLWPHLLYFVIRHFKLVESARAREVTLLLDGAIMGITLLLIKFSLSATLFSIIMVCFSFIVVGGMRLLILGSLTPVLSLIVSSFVF